MVVDLPVDHGRMLGLAPDGRRVVVGRHPNLDLVHRHEGSIPGTLVSISSTFFFFVIDASDK